MSKNRNFESYEGEFDFETDPDNVLFFNKEKDGLAHGAIEADNTATLESEQSWSVMRENGDGQV